MTSLEDLVASLSSSPPEQWEAVYAADAAEVTREQATAIAESDQPFANWFAFRFDAGPPGTSLPTPTGAMHAVLEMSGTSLDAYCALFHTQVTEAAPQELILALLCNAAGCSLRSGAGWLGTWISVRAGLAAIALGEPRRAWGFLDVLGADDPHDPHLDILRLFEPIRGNADLEGSFWVRAAICQLWPACRVPAVPVLPPPDADEDHRLPGEVLFERLEAVGAGQLAELVRTTMLATKVAGDVDQILNLKHEATQLRANSDDAALSRLREALQLSSTDDVLWAAIATDLVAATLQFRTAEEAASLGLSLLHEALCPPGPELGMLHVLVGDACTRAHRFEDARSHLEVALDLLRGTTSYESAVARLSLAKLGLWTDDQVLARKQIRDLEHDYDSLTPELRHDFHLLQAELVGSDGSQGARQEALTAAVDSATDEVTATAARARLIRAQLQTGNEVEGLVEFVEEAIGVAAGSPLIELLTDIVCNHGVAWPQGIMGKLIDWAEQTGQPSVVAWLHRSAERLSEARAVLAFALQGDLAPDERLTCLHQQMIVTSGPERRRICDTLERLLDVEDEPSVRADLAIALMQEAKGDVDAQHRALRHAKRALSHARDERVRRQAFCTAAKLTVELMRAHLPLSSPRQSDLVRWLVEAERPVELPKTWTAIVHALLLPGPVTHAACIDTARKILAWDAIDSDDAHALRVRLQWIESGERSEGGLSQYDGPFDEMSAWLVELVAGHSPPLALNQIAEAMTELSYALQCRPDTADSIFAAVLPWHEGMEDSAREELLGLVCSAVQRTSALSAGWPKLSATVRSLKPTAFVASIAAALNRAQHPSSRESTLTESAPGSQPNSNRALARSCFDEGTRLMSVHQLDPGAHGAEARIAKARQLLAEAVEIADSERRSELFDYLVSLGNAWKMFPAADVERALEIYARAEELGGVQEQLAKLWKVQADALRQRGGEGDLRVAAELLERSGQIRRGRDRAETARSAAQVALLHPDLSDIQRYRQAAEHLSTSFRADPAHAEQWLEFTLRVLEDWRRLSPADSRPDEITGELIAAYPSRAAQIDAQVPVLSEKEIVGLTTLLSHPAALAFAEVRRRLVPVSSLLRDDFGVFDRPENRAVIFEQLKEESLVDRPDEAEAFLDTLESSDGDTVPGVLAGRVLLLAFLARRGRRSVAEVRSATEQAVEATNLVEDMFVRSMLLREVALAWSPDDHVDDPVMDFDFAAELLEQCVQLGGGEEVALTETVGAWARALRYSRSSDRLTNLREARRLYALAHARPGLPSDVRATLAHNLGEVASHLSTGTRDYRLANQERQLEEAVKTAKSEKRRAELLTALGWVRTQLGNRFGGDEEVVSSLRRAMETFDEVEVSQLDATHRRSFEVNRAVCEAAQLRVEKGRDAEIGFWRNQISKLEPGSYGEATARHNLANALTRWDENLSAEGVAEALDLSHKAAEVRTREADARHSWGTSFNIGRFLTMLLSEDRLELLPMGRREAATQAREWLEASILAAECLGYGEELTQSAFALFALARCAESTKAMSELMEEAWSHLARAAGYLVFDEESREVEAWAAMQGGVELAYRLANEGIAVSSNDLAFVLQGEKAAIVARWLGRAQEPARRPLRARLSKPPEVSAGLWTDWQKALATAEPAAIASTLERIHDVDSRFLTEGGPDETTWAWLEADAGSLAVSFTLAQPFSLALLMQVDSDGRRRVWVLGLEVLDLPNAREGQQDRQVTWLRANLVEPIERFSGCSPKAILWNPGPAVRQIAPAALWPEIPVVTTTTLQLPDLTAAPSRPDSTLVVMADPAQSTGRFDVLGDHGVRGVQALTHAAREVGAVRLLASQGARYGRSALEADCPIRDTPASAQDLIEEVGEHNTVVLLAHGEVDRIDEAAIVCIDDEGNLERLDVQLMEQHPGRFTGVTFILLSCETGRVSDSLAKPGGLAGTLIAAGARCVVAPLWPVEIDAAVAVGEAVLGGIARGEHPSKTLARLQAPASSASPSLGPPLSAAERDARTIAQYHAFVTWVG